MVLVNDKTGVNAGFVKGGLVGSLQGRLASEKAKEWRQQQLGKWLSIGRVLYELIWVFTRGDLPINSLRDLQHRRILVGLRDGGTRRIAAQLLAANGVSTHRTLRLLRRSWRLTLLRFTLVKLMRPSSSPPPTPNESNSCCVSRTFG